MGKTIYKIEKDWLYKKYQIEKLSFKQIATIVGCCYETIRKKLIKYNIPIRTRKEGQQLNPLTGRRKKYERGKEHHFFGKKHTIKTKQKISQSQKKRCKKNPFPKGKEHWNYGKKHSKETKELWSKQRQGKNNPAWRGGVTPLYHKIRTCDEYKNWRFSIFERDKFTCQECGDNRGHNLNADHIKPMALIIKEYKLETIRQTKECKELWDIDNGKTLCKKCHQKTKTFGIGTKKLLKEN